VLQRHERSDEVERDVSFGAVEMGIGQRQFTPIDSILRRAPISRFPIVDVSCTASFELWNG
jgi:hypothetical protein